VCVAHERRLQAEEEQKLQESVIEKLKEEAKMAEQVKIMAEAQRVQELSLAREAEEEARVAMEEKLKASEMSEQAKKDVQIALEEMESKRRIRLVAEQNAAREMELAVQAAANSAKQVQQRMEAEKQLKLEAQLASVLEEELQLEAKRKLEALKLKECSQKEADEAELAANIAKDKYLKLQNDLNLSNNAANQAISEQKVSERSERALMKTSILAMNPAKWLQT